MWWGRGASVYGTCWVVPTWWDRLGERDESLWSCSLGEVEVLFADIEGFFTAWPKKHAPEDVVMLLVVHERYGGGNLCCGGAIEKGTLVM